jgi:hypothetical protein
MAWEATNWVVDDAQATGSDHEVIRFKVTTTIPNPTIATPQSRLNWSRTDSDSFSDTLHSLSTSTQSQWECLHLDPSPPHLDKWVETLQDSITTVAEHATPPLDPSPRSKCWWTPEVSAARHNMQQAHQRWKSSPNPTLHQNYCQLRNKYFRTICHAKPADVWAATSHSNGDPPPAFATTSTETIDFSIGFGFAALIYVSL